MWYGCWLRGAITWSFLSLAEFPLRVHAGGKVMSGNAFLIRLREMVTDQSLLPPESDTKRVGYRTALGYTGVQVCVWERPGVVSNRFPL